MLLLLTREATGEGLVSTTEISSLPKLSTDRYDHGCSAYVDSDFNVVLLVSGTDGDKLPGVHAGHNGVIQS